jgi:hypothetical protein
MSLVMLQPTDLPHREREVLVTPAAPAQLGLARRIAVGAPSGDLLDRLRALPMSSHLWSAPARAVREDPLGVSYTYDDRLREYDAYFDVERVDSAADGLFSHSLLHAYRSLLEEGLSSGTRMSWAEWTALCTTLQAMISLTAGVGAQDGRSVVVRPPLLRGNLDPHRRWRVGHQVFFVLTQSIVVALNSFRYALAEQDLAEAKRGLRLAARLLRGSAAAFVFTAEFSARQYHGGVRPAMEPPFVSSGFSGLLSPDHQYLVRLFAKLRPALRELPVELADDHRSFVRALEAVYEAHKYVCRRFGGDTGTSLRTSEASALPAVDVVHALKLARTKTVRRS